MLFAESFRMSDSAIEYGSLVDDSLLIRILFREYILITVSFQSSILNWGSVFALAKISRVLVRVARNPLRKIRSKARPLLHWPLPLANPSLCSSLLISVLSKSITPSEKE